jgi:hypothetical protein
VGKDNMNAEYPVDFTQGLTISPGSVSSGHYEGIRFMLGGSGQSSVDWDGNDAHLTQLRNLEIYEHVPPDSGVGPLKGFLFAGSAYKWFLGTTGFNDVIPGYNSSEYLGASDNEAVLAVPFSGIEVPAAANAVRFEVTWDLDGIITQYPGDDNTGDTADDIFVLKNGWWNGLDIKAVIE